MSDHTWSSSDLNAAAQLDTQGFHPEVIGQPSSRFALFVWKRTPHFDETLALLASDSLNQDSEALERSRKRLRTKAIFATASTRGSR